MQNLITILKVFYCYFLALNACCLTIRKWDLKWVMRIPKKDTTLTFPEHPRRQHHALNFPNIRVLRSSGEQRRERWKERRTWWQLSVWTKTLRICELKPNGSSLKLRKLTDNTSLVSPGVPLKCREGKGISWGLETERTGPSHRESRG